MSFCIISNLVYTNMAPLFRKIKLRYNSNRKLITFGFQTFNNWSFSLFFIISKLDWFVFFQDLQLYKFQFKSDLRSSRWLAGIPVDSYCFGHCDESRLNRNKLNLSASVKTRFVGLESAAMAEAFCDSVVSNTSKTSSTPKLWELWRTSTDRTSTTYE